MITSLTNKTVKNWMKLKTKKERDAQGLFLVDGRHMTQEALKAGVVETIITTDTSYKSDVLVEYVSENVMEKLSFTKTPQPFMAVCRKKKNILNEEGKRFIILDGVQDPGNVGTMIRTALAFSFDQVILSKDSCDLYNDKTLRSTQGAVFMMDIIRADLSVIIPELKKKGIFVVGSSLRDARDMNEISSREKMAFIMGNEGQGMKQEMLDLCDERLFIPIHTMESLNVGVAAGVIMYQFRGE